ncbi:MAG: hypothetical protein U0802_16870 [Candidatus Binatia bacterium]
MTTCNVPPGGERQYTPTIAVDLAKSVFEVACSDRPGRVRARHRFTRAQFAHFVATAAPATLVMEACGTAHYWGRRGAGARPPRRTAAAAVRPYVPATRLTAATPPVCWRRSATRRSGPCR